MKSIDSQLSVLSDGYERDVKPDDRLITQEVLPNPTFERFNRPGTLFLLPDIFQDTAVQRFVILLPSEPFSIPDLSLQIGRYTLPGSSLLIVARVTDPDQELTMRRELILLESLVRSPRLQVQSRLITNGSWMKVVKEISQQGDLIICLGDHKVQQFYVRSVSLGRKIYSDLHLPVLIHQDIHIWEQSPFQKAMREIAAWAIFIGIIFLFALLQIQVDRALTGSIEFVMLALTMFVEIYMIWKVNEFFR